jgi:hypothetical protein
MNLSRLKDAALEKALLAWLRPKVQRYGEIRCLSLNTAEKLLSAEIQLHGEEAPLLVSEARYRLEPGAQETRLIVYGVKLSREWAQNLLDDHAREIPLKIPEFVRTFIE